MIGSWVTSRVAKVTMEDAVQRIHPEYRTVLNEQMERVSRERTTFDSEHRLLMPDGAVKHLRVVGYPSEGEFEGLEFVGAVQEHIVRPAVSSIAGADYRASHETFEH